MFKGEKKESEFTEETLPLIRNNRWSREDDRFLFKTIRNFENKNLISLEHIMQVKIRNEAAKDAQLNHLAKKVGWSGPIRNMIKRIRSLCDPHPLSVREMKLMKRLIRRKYLLKEIDFEELTDNFPGRTLDFITPIAQEAKMKMTASMTN